MVISSKNPVHSVLFLILSFVSASGLFVLLGAEFLAMILIVVYVGAVAVLFLFVVMMLDINFVKLREGFLQYLPFGALLGLVLLIELIMIFFSDKLTDMTLIEYNALPAFKHIENTKEIGSVLYTKYFYLFQLSGLILLVAMIGSIVLTLRQRTGVKKQSIHQQINVDAKKAIEKSLKAAGMFGGLSGDYTLKATLVDSDIGNIFSTRSYKRKMIINYKLINDISGEVLYDKTITGHGKGEFYIITFDHYGREQDVAEKAFKDNFRQLIEDLKSL